MRLQLYCGTKLFSHQQSYLLTSSPSELDVVYSVILCIFDSDLGVEVVARVEKGDGFIHHHFRSYARHSQNNAGVRKIMERTSRTTYTTA